MAKQSPQEINKMIQYIRPTNDELVRRDIDQAIYSSTSNLELKVERYYYNDGTSTELLCLSGVVACEYRKIRYNIPIEIWLQQNHPHVPPVVYVKPTSSMHVSPTSRDVLPDGNVVIPYLNKWCQSQNDFNGLLNAMSEAFSRSPPVYTIVDANNHPTLHAMK